MLSVNSLWFSFSSVCESVFFEPSELLRSDGYHLLWHVSLPLPSTSSLLPPQLGVCSHRSVPCSSSSAKGSTDTIPAPAVGCRKGGRTAEAAAAALGLWTCVFHFIFQLGISHSALWCPAKSIFLLQPLRGGSACCVPLWIPAPD